MSRDELFDILSHHKLKRWAANWARVIIRICGISCLDWAKRNVFRRRWASNAKHFVQMDFDSTLGFPGEGPPRRPPRFHLGCSSASNAQSPHFVLFRAWIWCLFVFWFSACFGSCHLSLVCFVLLSGRQQTPVLMLSGAMAMPVTPCNCWWTQTSWGTETSGTACLEGRPVQPITGSNRERYSSPSSDSGLRMKGSTLDALLDNSHVWVEEINILLCRFGRQLFRSWQDVQSVCWDDKQHHFYQTIVEETNAGCVGLGLCLDEAGTLTTSPRHAWSGFAVHDYHIPNVGVGFLCKVCLALGWGSLLRPGEIFNMQRRNLLFPFRLWFFS